MKHRATVMVLALVSFALAVPQPAAAQPATRPTSAPAAEDSPATRPARPAVPNVNETVELATRAATRPLWIGHPPDTTSAKRDERAALRRQEVEAAGARLHGLEGRLTFEVRDVLNLPDNPEQVEVKGRFESVIDDRLTEDARRRIAEIRRETTRAIDEYRSRPSGKPRRSIDVMPERRGPGDSSSWESLEAEEDVDAVTAIRRRGEARVEAVKASCRIAVWHSVTLLAPRGQTAEWGRGETRTARVGVSGVKAIYTVASVSADATTAMMTKLYDPSRLDGILRLNEADARRARVRFEITGRIVD